MNPAFKPADAGEQRGDAGPLRMVLRVERSHSGLLLNRIHTVAFPLLKKTDRRGAGAQTLGGDARSKDYLYTVRGRLTAAHQMGCDLG